MPDKRAKDQHKDTPIIPTLDSAGVKGRNRRIRVSVGDRVSVELSPYDLARGRITYRFKEGVPQPPDVTIEGSQPEIIIEDTWEELYRSINECVAAVAQAHEQIEKNRPEIEALGKETRRLLSELNTA